MTTPSIPDETTHDEITTPALLRAARGVYAQAIKRRVSEAGLDDIPRNGPFILGGMGNHGFPANGLLSQLGVSKQAASQLIDVLVVRGYLERGVDHLDRRRMTIELTERGHAAAELVSAAINDVDRELAKRLSPETRAAMRAGLSALADINEFSGHDS